MRWRRVALFLVLWLAVARCAFAQLDVGPLQDEAVRWLQAYIRIDTINPRGNEASGVEFFKAIFDAEGITYQTAHHCVWIHAGRHSLRG
jgi:acetylornithine deacetylase/succinyl-diaminopimelate desuccinylase-like protein